MTKLREAAQAALEVLQRLAEHDQHCGIFDLDEYDCHRPCTCGLDDSMVALRAALAAEPAQPFCYLKQTSSSENPPHGWAVHFTEGDVALYTAPQPPAAEQAQPVAWIQSNHLQLARQGVHFVRMAPTKHQSDYIPLYTAPQPPADVPRLTDADISAIAERVDYKYGGGDEWADQFARAVETEVRRRCGVVG